jgi:hypothetical protein
MTQEAQRPNPNADNITPVRHRQSPTKSGCRSGELTVPVKYEEAYERARNVAENNQTKSQSCKRRGEGAMPPRQDDAERRHRNEWNYRQKGVCDV